MIWVALEIIFILLFSFYGNYLFLIFIGGCIYLFGKRNRKSIFIVGQTIAIFFIAFRFNYFNIVRLDNLSDEFVVVEEYSNYVILENEGNKFLYYDNNLLDRGNVITLNGEIRLIEEDNSFSSYLKSQRVNYLIEGKIIDNSNTKSFNEKVIDVLLKNKDQDNKSNLKLILFNKHDEYNKSLYDSFYKFSITFMIVISGYHINLLFKVLNKTKFIKYLFTLFYLYLLNFSVSSLKAFLYYCLRKISKKFNLILNNFDILSLIMISLLIYNPSYCFNKGFIYSFSFSFFIDLINNILYKKSLVVEFIKKLLIYSFSIPLILMDSFELNSMSLIVSIIFSHLISFLFVFSLVYLFLDKFYLIYKLYIYLLKLLLDFISWISFDFVFGKAHAIILILLYFCILLFLFFYQNRYFKSAYFLTFIYISILLIQYNIPNIDIREKVYFLDVGQGDCTVLKIPNSKKVVLIDTGGSKYRDIGSKVIIPFLKSKGINKIDLIVVTHDDFDHNGAKESIIDNFKVDKVIEDSSVEEVQIGNKKFLNLNVNNSRDNDGSIVLYGNYGGIKYLFSGDITSDKEKEIIENNEFLNVDVLKVSHHGSSGSSSLEFLRHINPKIALIGAGENNIYKHPSDEVLERLEELNVKTYITSKDGSIGIYKSSNTDNFIIEKE